MNNQQDKPGARAKVDKDDADWRRELTLEQYKITRMHGTERPFTHPYNNEKRAGVYNCVCCGAPLFKSDAKYDSGTGWPSFFEPESDAAVETHTDKSLFMVRTEVRCAACDAHLGHVFPDGPDPTGQRYCMNGTALEFEAGDDE